MANENNEEIILSVRNLCQYFRMGGHDFKAVDDVSFDIKKGEVFGLVGESGCGKTTTGRTIIKLYNATGGDVYFKGHRIVAGTLHHKRAIAAAKKEANDKIAELKASLLENSSLEEKDSVEKQIKAIKAACDEKIKSEKNEIKLAKYDQKHCDNDYKKYKVSKIEEKYKPLLESASDPEAHERIENDYKKELHNAKHSSLVKRIQMIYQDPIASLDPRMTVKDIIAEGLYIQGEKDKDVINEKVYKMLELVGLVREHATRYPHEFSGGQRQRIGIARSIVMEPDFIIADEPVSALDVSIQAQVINLLNELREQLGLTILFIAHDLSVVKYFSDRIGVMYFGKMVELASSDELFKHPLHPYTRSLLSAIPLPDPRSEKARKRIVYNPLADHNYTKEGPTMREVVPGHFVYCNSEEFEKYKKICTESEK